MPETPSTPEQRLLTLAGEDPVAEPAWVNGEIRAHPAPGWFIGCMLVGMGLVAVATDKTPNKVLGLSCLSLVVLFTIPLLRLMGKGAKWDHQGIQFTWFGRPKTFVPWSDHPHLGLTAKITTAKGQEFSLPQTQSPKQSSVGDLIRAIMCRTVVEDPRQRKYRAPPPPEKTTRVFRQLAWVMAFGSLLAFTAFLQHMRALTEAGQWPPDMRTLYVALLFAFAYITLGSQVSNHRRLRANAYLWKPEALPWIRAWFASKSEIPPWKPDELVSGRLYAYAQTTKWQPKSAGELTLVVLCLAATLAFLFAVRDRGSSTLPMIVAAVLVSVAYLSWQNIVRLERQNMPDVDTLFILEATPSGIVLWKDGVATAPLSYPKRLSVKWSKWLLGGDVELWSDGEQQFAIDRRYMAVLIEEAPAEIRYAATEGGGWLHPESKAIAAQMLAERDWSKPLPKKSTHT